MIPELEAAKAQLVQWIEDNPEPKGKPFVITTMRPSHQPTMMGDMGLGDHRKVQAIKKLAMKGYEGYTPEVVNLVLSARTLTELYEKICDTPLWDKTVQSGKMKVLNPRCKNEPKLIAQL